MKILIIKENGRNPENKYFGEAYNLKRAFERIGHECKIWGLGHENFTEPFESFYHEYDVIFILENYEEGNWIPDLSEIKKLKVFWSIDSHCNPYGNIHTANKHNVDLVLNSIESDKLLFQGRRTVYFPNCCPTDLIYPIEEIEKTNFMGFCGTPFEYRQSIMNYIESNTQIKIKRDTYVLGHEMVKSINSYKIHFNCSENADINSRVFETLGTRTCLLTTNNENIKTHFDDMVDLVIYDINNLNGLIDKINFLKNNPDLIDKIAESGYNKVIKHHTFDERAKKFIEIIKTNL
jgi:hypothetical protein